MRTTLRMAALAALLSGSSANAATVGLCKFDTDALSFAGTPIEQARCLLRPVKKFAKLGPALDALPPQLASLIGTPARPDSAKLKAALVARNIATGSFGLPVSRASNGASSAPRARYFVIHDTSTPWLGDQAFPPDIDSSTFVNGLERYMGANAVAHVFVNRSGATAFGHDFSAPWRATKLETKVVGVPSKGLFLHVENVQPRRRDPAGGPKNDAIAPSPGLSQAQYDRLAALYAYASHRAGSWLVPAYHAALDAGLSDGHDDPQNFELAKFDSALSSFLLEIQ